MKPLSKVQNTIYLIGAVLVLVGAATFITGWHISPYIYMVGAAGFSAMQMLARYDGSNFIIRRLRRQQLFGALLILLTSVPMMMQSLHRGFAQRNEWVVCLTVAAVVELYTAWRIPAELEKEKNGGRK